MADTAVSPRWQADKALLARAYDTVMLMKSDTLTVEQATAYLHSREVLMVAKLLLRRSFRNRLFVFKPQQVRMLVAVQLVQRYKDAMFGKRMQDPIVQKLVHSAQAVFNVFMSLYDAEEKEDKGLLWKRWKTLLTQYMMDFEAYKQWNRPYLLAKYQVAFQDWQESQSSICDNEDDADTDKIHKDIAKEMKRLQAKIVKLGGSRPEMKGRPLYRKEAMTNETLALALMLDERLRMDDNGRFFSMSLAQERAMKAFEDNFWALVKKKPNEYAMRVVKEIFANLMDTLPSRCREIVVDTFKMDEMKPLEEWATDDVTKMLTFVYDVLRQNYTEEAHTAKMKAKYASLVAIQEDQVCNGLRWCLEHTLLLRVEGANRILDHMAKPVRLNGISYLQIKFAEKSDYNDERVQRTKAWLAESKDIGRVGHRAAMAWLLVYNNNRPEEDEKLQNKAQLPELLQVETPFLRHMARECDYLIDCKVGFMIANKYKKGGRGDDEWRMQLENGIALTDQDFANEVNEEALNMYKNRSSSVRYLLQKRLCAWLAGKGTFTVESDKIAKRQEALLDMMVKLTDIHYAVHEAFFSRHFDQLAST